MNTLDIHQVMKHLPHRYPILLVDRVLDFQKDVSLTALKNVTINEPFFNGHFPHRPVMPGVLILEALAQASAILAFKCLEVLPGDDSVYYFVGIDEARFKRPVEPGDQLMLHTRLKRRMRGMWIFDTEAKVDNETAASAQLMCTYKAIA